MNVYKHIVYNPHMENITNIIEKAQDIENLECGREWYFLRSQPVTEYEWVAIFERWQNETIETSTIPSDKEINKNYYAAQRKKP